MAPSTSILTDASRQLFNRAPDERFTSLPALWEHCHKEKESSQDRWAIPEQVHAMPHDGRLQLSIDVEPFTMNDWSFGQLCKLAEVSKETINRLSPDTAGKVFAETLPRQGKPLQILTRGQIVRAVHSASYTRLHNVDLLTMVREFATDFEPPQKGIDQATGLYCGEQDMFVFLIDPTGWAEIEGEAFAPGFFLWNSEVGKRSLGVKTFWFQAVCQNHIVWDATEIVDFSRKHTANVHEALREIRDIIARLVETRDSRRDGFVAVMKKAMRQHIGDNAEEALDVLQKRGITRALAKEAVAIAEAQGRFTIFALVDALTRLSARMKFAGDRADADEKASALLRLVHNQPNHEPVMAAVA
jgi:hypothetical protein